MVINGHIATTQPPTTKNIMAGDFINIQCDILQTQRCSVDRFCVVLSVVELTDSEVSYRCVFHCFSCTDGNIDFVYFTVSFVRMVISLCISLFQLYGW